MKCTVSIIAAAAVLGSTQAALAQNPMYVPLSDREFLWNQLVDTIDNYFRIQREERVRLVVVLPEIAPSMRTRA